MAHVRVPCFIVLLASHVAAGIPARDEAELEAAHPRAYIQIVVVYLAMASVIGFQPFAFVEDVVRDVVVRGAFECDDVIRRAHVSTNREPQATAPRADSRRGGCYFQLLAVIVVNSIEGIIVGNEHVPRDVVVSLHPCPCARARVLRKMLFEIKKHRR